MNCPSEFTWSVYVDDELPDAEQPPPKDLSWSLPMAILAVTAVLTIGGLLIELRLPGVLDLLNPKRLIGVNKMVFDTIFMLRSRWPELADAIALVGGMAAFSAMGCAALHALSRHLAKASSLSILLMFLFASPDIARALDLRNDEDQRLSSARATSSQSTVRSTATSSSLRNVSHYAER